MSAPMPEAEAMTVLPAADGELIGGGELIQYDAADMGCASTARQMTYRHLCNVVGGPGTGPQRELL